MNHSVVTVDGTIITAPITSPFTNTIAQNSQTKFHDEQQRLDCKNETILRSTKQTIEQSFETISRISTTNPHQLSLSLKISLQEKEGDFILRDATSKHNNNTLTQGQDSSQASSEINSKLNQLKSCSRATPQIESADKYTVRSQQNSNNLPDIINNVVQSEAQRYQCNNDSRLTAPGLETTEQDEANAPGAHNESKRVLVLSNKLANSESSMNTVRADEDEDQESSINHNTKESPVDESEKLRASDKDSSNNNTKESKDRPNKEKMEVSAELDTSLKITRHSDSNSDQSNSDSGLGTSSHNSFEKSNNSTLCAPPSESPNSSLISTSDGEQRDPKEVDANNDGNTVSKNLKSLLKEPGTRSKHNRRVTFDQTVIVFCEEIDPAFMTNEHGNSFDPPSEYSDSSHPFDPPDDYRDDDASSDDEIDGRDYDEVFERNNYGMLCCDLDIEAEERLKNIIMAGGANFREDQLLGMLKEDALLQAISMTVDELGEEDFPIHFNSHQSNSLDEQISDGEYDNNQLHNSANRNVKQAIKDQFEVSMSNDKSGNRQRLDQLENKERSKKETKVASSSENDENKPQHEESMKTISLADPSGVHIRAIQNCQRQDEIKLEDANSDQDSRTGQQIKSRVSQGEATIIHASQEKSQEKVYVLENSTQPKPTTVRVTSNGDFSKKNVDLDPEGSNEQKDDVSSRQSVTIRQAVVESVPVSRAIVLNNQEEPGDQSDECKQCGNNGGLVANQIPTCQSQSCLQSGATKVAGQNPTATIIRITSQPASAQSNALVGKIFNSNCATLVNEKSHQIVIPSRQVDDQKSACHLCRNLENEQIVGNSRILSQPNSMPTEVQQTEVLYPHSTNERVNCLGVASQISKISAQNGQEMPKLSHVVPGNINQDILAQPQAPRPCCDAARRCQIVGYPTPIRPINKICSSAGARRVVYFVNQQGNTVGTGSIPIAKAHIVTSQINTKNNSAQPVIYNTIGTSNNNEQIAPGVARLPTGTTIYCNDANCSLLKNSTRRLDNPVADLRCTSVNCVAPPGNQSLQPVQQSSIARGAYICQPNAIPDDKIGTNTRSRHTVYYIQHNLDKPSTMRYGLESNPNLKSHFPTAHEVRRLDGLNAPPLTHNASLIRSQKGVSSDVKELETFVIQDQRRLEKIRKRYSMSSTDEADDPSFGFSKRPSVKVITKTVSSKQAYRKNDVSNSNITVESSVGGGDRLTQVNNQEDSRRQQHYSQTMNPKTSMETLHQLQNRPMPNRPTSINDVGGTLQQNINLTLISKRDRPQQVVIKESQVRKPVSAFFPVVSGKQQIPSSSSQPLNAQINSNTKSSKGPYGNLNRIDSTIGTLPRNWGSKVGGDLHVSNQYNNLIHSNDYGLGNKIIIRTNNAGDSECRAGQSNLISDNRKELKSNENVQPEKNGEHLKVAHVVNV